MGPAQYARNEVSPSDSGLMKHCVDTCRAVDARLFYVDDDVEACERSKQSFIYKDVQAKENITYFSNFEIS